MPATSGNSRERLAWAPASPLPTSHRLPCHFPPGQLEREAAARQLSIHGVELTISGRLNNVLVHIGVIGEKGHAGFEYIQGVMYVATEASEADMQQAWEAMLDRSPLFNTFSRSAEVHISLRIVV